MTPATFRKSRGLSQAQFAEALGLEARSKGYVSRLEAGRQPWPLRLALKLEKLSDGEVQAASICAEARALGAATSAATAGP